MMLDSTTVDARVYGDGWDATAWRVSVQAAHRAAAVKPTAQQRKRYDAAYRAKRRKAGKSKHAGHLSGAAWHAARARAA